MESDIPELSNRSFPMIRTIGNAKPTIPRHFLKKRYDRTRVCAFEFDVADIPFLRLLGRSELFSSHEQDTKTESI